MSTRTQRLISGATIAMLLFNLSMPTAMIAAPTAPTFTVNSPADIVASAPLDNGVCETAPGNGVCTLRAAIMKANHYAGGGVTINFGLAGPVTYTLTIPPSGMDGESSGDLFIANTMTIVGNGATNTIIDGNNTDRVFIIGSGDTATISGVTIKNGRVSACDAFGVADGGGIENSGTLALINSTVSGNAPNCSSHSFGGGISNLNVLTVTNSTVSGNTVSGSDAHGGGIYAKGQLTLVNSTVSGNTTPGDGGGIFGRGMMISNSTVSGNTGRNGGGIYVNGSDGFGLTRINSTVSGNNSNVNGGGIYSVIGPTSLFNVTITGNLANADSSGNGFGGGVANPDGTFNFQNSIIGGNNNIVIINGFPLLNPEDCSGTLTSQGNNIMDSPSDCTVSGGGVTLADPILGPLANNGGPTNTHALLAGSPAIDAGNAGGCTDNFGAILTTDQRGWHRPFGSRCDIGAYERGAFLFLPLILR